MCFFLSCFMCVYRHCVQLWCSLTCCRPWRWCSVAQMLCAPPGIQPSLPRISWPNVLARGYRWSSCTRTNSLVSVYRCPLKFLSRFPILCGTRAVHNYDVYINYITNYRLRLKLKTQPHPLCVCPEHLIVCFFIITVHTLSFNNNRRKCSN